MGRRPSWLELGAVALVVGLVACSDGTPVTDGAGVSGLKLDLEALYFNVYGSTPKSEGGPFALTDRPTLEAVLVAVDQGGERSQPKVEKFPLPLDWYFEDSADELACSYSNQKQKTITAECREPGYHTFCVKTVVDGRPVQGCNTFKFQ